MPIDQLDLEYFEEALDDVERAGFPELARRLRTFVTATVGTADAAILPVTPEHKLAAWNAFYTRTEYAPVPPRPGDRYDTILLEDLGRAIENDRRIVAAAHATAVQDPALAAGTSTHSTPQGDRSV